MEEKELLLQLATKLFNKTEEEVSQIIYDGEKIKDDSFDTLLQMDTARVKRFKDESTIRFNDGYKKAQSEIMPEIEKKIRTEFEISEEATFDELIPKVKEKIATGSKSKLTDDEVKKHPVYLELEKNRIPKDVYEQKINEFETYKTGIERQNKMSKVREKALLFLDEFKPAFPDDENIKNNLKNVYLSEFEKFDDYEISEDGSIIAVKDGKRVEDAHGNPVPFKQLAKEKASGYFQFMVQTPKGGAGNGSGAGSGVAAAKWKDYKEFSDYYGTLTNDADKREAIKKGKELGYIK